ncbi:MAG: hypothetical protein JNK50_07940 [Bacteroidia bacterium]|nr:hypothetical protein [Bacteroidia bacterium]
MFFAYSGNACDICGCFMGITPYDNQSQISFLHRYRVFNGYREYNQHSSLFPQGAYKTTHAGHEFKQDSLRTYSSKDFESYKSFELRFKYFIHKRIEINSIVPFNHNKSKEDNISNSISGMGDPTLLIGYHLVQKADFQVLQQRLIIGGGIKFPVGNFKQTNALNNRIDLLQQVGTGSFDYITYINYVLGYKKSGFSFNCMYKLNGHNSYNEKICNSVSSYLNIFYKLKTKNLIFIPAINTYYEYCEGLLINNILQSGTSMNCLLAGPGMDVYYKNFSLTCSYQFNMFEKTEMGNLKNAGRLIAGLSYNFNQRHYLLSRKVKSHE